MSKFLYIPRSLMVKLALFYTFSGFCGGLMLGLILGYYHLLP